MLGVVGVGGIRGVTFANLIAWVAVVFGAVVFGTDPSNGATVFNGGGGGTPQYHLTIKHLIQSYISGDLY